MQFCPTRVGESRALTLVALCIAPEQQRKGIGTQALRVALTRLTDEGHHTVLALGPPGFLGRVGFLPAEPRGIPSPWHGTGDRWMVFQLSQQPRPTGMPDHPEVLFAFDRDEEIA
jgi:putative acetyltransferase